MSDPYAAFATTVAPAPQSDPYAGIGTPVEAGVSNRATVGAGLTEGVTGTVGGLVDMLNPVNRAREFGHDVAGAYRAARDIAEGRRGDPKAMMAEERAFQEENAPTTHRLNQGLEAVTGYSPENVPQGNAGQRVLRTISSALPGALIPVGEPYTVANLLKNIVVAAGAGTGAGVARELAPEEAKDAAGFLGGLLGGIGVGVGTHGVGAARRAAAHAAEPVIAAVARPEPGLSAEIGVPASTVAGRRAAEVIRNRATNPQTVAELLRSPDDVLPHEDFAARLSAGQTIEAPGGRRFRVAPNAQRTGHEVSVSTPGNAVQSWGAPEGAAQWSLEDAVQSATREAFPDAPPLRAAPAPSELVPGSEPTTFQKTGDLGLGALEREQAVKNPPLFIARQAEQQEARVTALQDIQRDADPNALSETLRQNLDALDKETQGAVEAATAKAAKTAETIGGAGTPEAAGTATRETLAAAEDTARQQERGLWRAVDPNGDLTGNVSETRTAASDIVGKMPKTAKPLAGEEAGVFEAAQAMQPLTPVSELIALRSRVSDAMRNELVANGRSASYARLVQLRGAIQDNLSNTIAHRVAAEEAAAARGEIAAGGTVADRIQAWVDEYRTARAADARAIGDESVAGAPAVGARPGAGADGAGIPRSGGPGGAAGDQGLPSGEPLAPTFDEAAAARLQAATEATKARARTFGMEPVSPTLAKAGAADLYRLPEARVPEKFFHPGKAAFGHMQALYAAVGREVGAKLMGEYAALSLRRAAMEFDGTLNPVKYQRWAAQHSDALRALPPEVGARFADAAQASRTVAAVQAARTAALKEAQAGAIGRLLGATEPEDVTRTIGNVLGSRTAVADMGRIAKAAEGNPAAKAGLRQAVADFMLGRVLSNAEAGTSGVNALKGDTFATFFKRARPALAKVFTPAELDGMEAVAADVQRARRSIDATKLSGGSNTSQDILGVRRHLPTTGLVSNSILGVLTERLASVATHNEPMALAAGLGIAVTAAMRDAGLHRIDDLVTHAMLHPKVAEALLRRFPAEPGGKAALELAAALRRSVAPTLTANLAQVGSNLSPALPASGPLIGTAPPADLPKPVKPGNLDPWNRKILHNPDGSYSTTSSISVGTDSGEVLIPTVVNGKRLSEQDAIAHFRETGENFGTFRTPKEADAYAQWLHEEQARVIAKGHSRS